jgi:hypothetical protein
MNGARRVHLAAALLCVVATVSTGCVPFPAVVPPVQASIAGGGAVGRELAGAGQFRVGLHAGSFGEWAYDRPVDAGVGFVHEATFPDLVPDGAVDGPYGRFALRIWRDRVKRHGMSRALLFADGQALTADGDRWGGGFDIGTTIEIVSLTSQMVASVVDDQEGTVLVGWAHGESAMGLTLSGGWRSVAGEQYGQLMVALTVRLPSILGLVLIPVDP